MPLEILSNAMCVNISVKLKLPVKPYTKEIPNNKNPEDIAPKI
tara:strand:+ start:32 stop:160 length:129 start_codon:yes stop_codon:yes gene_type:complete